MKKKKVIVEHSADKSVPINVNYHELSPLFFLENAF